MVSYPYEMSQEVARDLVLILIVVEDGLVHKNNIIHNSKSEVLILIVVEDGLVQINQIATISDVSLS